MELGATFNGGFFLLYSPNVGIARTFPKQSCQFRELLLVADGVDLNVAAVQVAHVSAHPDGLGRILREVAETDALHAAADDVITRLFGVAHVPISRAVL